MNVMVLRGMAKFHQRLQRIRNTKFQFALQAPDDVADFGEEYAQQLASPSTFMRKKSLHPRVVPINLDTLQERILMLAERFAKMFVKGKYFKTCFQRTKRMA